MSISHKHFCNCSECRLAEEAERKARPRKKSAKQYSLPVYPFVSVQLEIPFQRPPINGR